MQSRQGWIVALPTPSARVQWSNERGSKIVKGKNVQGKNVLYQFLQNDLRNRSEEGFRWFVRELMALGIWFPRSAYAVLPIALPHVVRDRNCRKRGKGTEEQWGSPDESGYIRDDNSRIKSLVRSFPIESDFAPYKNNKLGAGFVAAHIWPETTGQALTNSFWPNLVWLPTNLARLTDREGFARQFVQGLSYKIYRDVEIHPQLEPFVQQAWEQIFDMHTRQYLEAVEELAEQELPEIETLNFFKPTKRFFTDRLKAIRLVSAALNDVAEGNPLPEKVITKRYRPGLEKKVVSKGTAKKLSRRLAQYTNGVEASREAATAALRRGRVRRASTD